LARFAEVFELFDVDGSGEIDTEEFTGAVNTVSGDSSAIHAARCCAPPLPALLLLLLLLLPLPTRRLGPNNNRPTRARSPLPSLSHSSASTARCTSSTR